MPKRGDTRSDGKVFWKVDRGSECWVSKQDFAKKKTMRRDNESLPDNAERRRERERQRDRANGITPERRAYLTEYMRRRRADKELREKEQRLNTASRRRQRTAAIIDAIRLTKPPEPNP